ncbi:MAG: gfo/Idh/MocA family oxidoreductase [Chloroflexi bacterium]|nr:MAG: gfo/Idh/MocA family oxidoreductase [Chloroflexota bacterium]
MSKVACIGAGQWGKNLIRCFLTLGALHAVCDTDYSRLEELSRLYPGVRFTDCWYEVMEDREVKGVVIATPSQTHFDIAMEALRAGKDVLVEKPMTLSTGDGERLVAEARSRKKVLMVGHVMRYHPAIDRIKLIMDSGQLGELYMIYSSRLNFGRFRKVENVLWSFAPHDISITLYLAGAMPERFSIFGTSKLTADIEDSVMVQLGFPNGIDAQLHLSWLHPYKEQKLIVMGKKGVIVFDGVCNKLELLPHDIVEVSGSLVGRKSEVTTIELPQVEPLLEECRHFLHCINTRTNPITDGHEGLRVLKVLESCQSLISKEGSNL